MASVPYTNNVRTSITLAQDELAAKITRIRRKTGQGRAQVIRTAMGLFVESAVKDTPPNTVAKDCVTKGRRRIIPLTMDDCRTFQAFVSDPKNRVKNPHVFWEYIQRNWKKDHPWVQRFKINFRWSRKRRTMLFPSLAQARRHEKIDYRNVGKMAWLAAARATGVPTKAKKPTFTGALVGRVMGQIGGGVAPKVSQAIIVKAFLEANAYNMRRYAMWAVATSLRRTNSRLYHQLKKLEAEVARA